MQILYLLILLFLITSFEIGSFNVFFGSDLHNAAVVVCFLSVLIYFLFRASKYRKIINSGYLSPSEFKYFFLIILVSGVYFIFHSLIVGPLGSAKYSAYVLILFILITQFQKIFFDKFCKIFFIFMAIVSAAAVFQILLVAISGSSIYDFEPLKKNGDLWFRAVDYAMPYFLTYSSMEESVTFGPLTFVRAIGFSSEPKFFSVLLWAAYGICLSWTSLKSRAPLFLIRASLLLGLFFAHAYSSLLVFVLAALFYFILKKATMSDKFKVFLILGVPIFVSIAVTFAGAIILEIMPAGSYQAQRMESFIYTSGGFYLFEIPNFGMIGSNLVSEENELVSGVTMLLHWARLGHLGFLLYLMPIAFIIYKSIVNFRYLEKHQMYSQAILLSVFITYYQIFISQPYTLFSIFILASLYIRSRSFIRRGLDDAC